MPQYETIALCYDDTDSDDAHAFRHARGRARRRRRRRRIIVDDDCDSCSDDSDFVRIRYRRRATCGSFLRCLTRLVEPRERVWRVYKAPRRRREYKIVNIHNYIEPTYLRPIYRAPFWQCWQTSCGGCHHCCAIPRRRRVPVVYYDPYRRWDDRFDDISRRYRASPEYDLRHNLLELLGEDYDDVRYDREHGERAPDYVRRGWRYEERGDRRDMIRDIERALEGSGRIEDEGDPYW